MLFLRSLVIENEQIIPSLGSNAIGFRHVGFATITTITDWRTAITIRVFGKLPLQFVVYLSLTLYT